MPTISGLRSWEVSERWSLSAGAELGAFGFSDESRWIGVLAGPFSRANFRPARWPLLLGLGLHGSVGRIPVCNNWGLCLRYIGIYPAGDLSRRVEPSGYVGATW